MNFLTWCRVVSQAGLGLSLSKYFGLISGLHKKRFYGITSTGTDFFLS